MFSLSALQVSYVLKISETVLYRTRWVTQHSVDESMRLCVYVFPYR